MSTNNLKVILNILKEFILFKHDWNTLKNRPFYEETIDGETVVHKLDARFIPDEHISSLIDDKLGVIENGSY